ncbi:MAG: hypothetical protein ACREQB_10270 [Candidatus Binataceae bacterium]
MRKGVMERGAKWPIVLAPPVAERVALESAPNPATVESYVLTRAAERAWRQINSDASTSDRGIYWVHGAPGSGKTHFLNYVLALERRAGSGGAGEGRHITCDLDIAGRASAQNAERLCLEVLAKELAGDPRSRIMWREMRGPAAIGVALEHARRTGVGSITIAFDFGADDCAEAMPLLAALAAQASQARGVRLRVFAAVRDRPSDSALAMEVGPADSNEAAVVALRRTRRLADDASKAVARAYRGVDTNGFDAEDIYPFHPAVVRALVALATPAATVEAISRLASEVLSGCEPRTDGAAGADWLVRPATLMQTAAVSAQIEAKLGDSGRAALRIARAASASFGGDERQTAADIVDTLVVQRASAGERRLGLGALAAQLRAPVNQTEDDDWASTIVNGVVRKLVDSTHGVIDADAARIRFEPSAASAPEIAKFNAASTLVRLFAPELDRVHSVAELKTALTRLGEAMADAVEKAAGEGEVLKAEMASGGAKDAGQHEQTIADYMALAEAGPARLLSTATDAGRAARATRTISEYEAVAIVAAAVPKLRAMREYVAGTRLGIGADAGLAREREIARLQTDCQLLGVELGPRALVATRSSLDALEARFEKFRSNYSRHYRISHASGQHEMSRAASAWKDAQSYCEALRRLNAISALGPPQGESMHSELAALAARIVHCDVQGDPQADGSPVCARCGHVLGAQSPQAELAELFERIRATLKVKLAALSQSAIARLIREHDRTRRLEGFLKITQAAQTDALVRVLDEKLARYLAQLLDENLAVQNAEQIRAAEPIDSPNLNPFARTEASVPRVGGPKRPRQRGDN